MSSLTQLFKIGRGLTQLPDSTIEVLPDGNTITFDINNKLTLFLITRAMMADGARAQLFVKYYENLSGPTVSYDAPFLLQGWKLLRVNVVTRGWSGDANNYWQLTIGRVDTSGNSTTIGSINCIPSTVSPTWISSYVGPFTADANYVLYCQFQAVGAPSNFTGYVEYVIALTDTLYQY